MSRVKAVTDASFEQEVLHSQLPVLVDFWAPWCGPCKTLAPILEKMAEEFEGKIKFLKMDTQANTLVPGRMGIRSIPTLLLFKEGEVKDVMIGVRQPADLWSMLDRASRPHVSLWKRLFGKKDEKSSP